MAYVYYPGCKYTALSPENSDKMKKYLRERFGAKIAGCCRKDDVVLEPGDTALCVCPTCMANLRHSAPQATAMGVWELLAGDDAFPWPEYHGLPVTVQGCKDTRNDAGLQSAFRAVLRRMNAQPVELDATLAKMDFCRPRTEEETEAVRRHCAAYETEVAVCHCTGCLAAIRAAGVHGVHLMDMLMGEL